MKTRLSKSHFALALVITLLSLIPAHSVRAGTTYYSQGSFDPAITTNWNSARGGGGTAPTNFTAGDTFVIQNGHNMTNASAWSVSGSGSKLWVENGGTLTANYTVTLASATTFQIDAGGTYIHNNTAAFGANIFQGAESFDPASTVILNTSNSVGPSNVVFGNLTVDFTSDPGSSVNCAGGITAIAGTFKVVSTSAREFRLTGSTPLTLTIDGDVLLQGGVLDWATSTGNPIINIGGSFTQTGGTIKSSGSVAVMNFTGGAASEVHFSTSGGTFTNGNLNWQIDTTKTVALNTSFGAGAWVAAGRNMTVTGAMQINQGAYPGDNNGTWVYNASTGRLIFNNTSGSYGVDNRAWWPTTSGPQTVTVQGGGGLTMNTPRTVGGLFQLVAGAVSNASPNQLTLNGRTQIEGGNFANAPIYGSSSELIYKTTYTVFNEWTGSGGSAGSGQPQNVIIDVGSGTVSTPNSNRGVPGNITITTGSLALHATSGDLYVGGNWADTGTFTPNNRAVFFNGNGAQTINTAETFAYLILDKPAGTLTLAQNVTVTANDSNGNPLQLLNNGELDLNGRALKLTNAGGEIKVDGALRTITSSAAGGVLSIAGSKTLTYTNNGQLTTGPNVAFVIEAGGTFGLGTLATPVNISGSLYLSGTLNMSSIVGGDIALEGDWVQSPSATFNNGAGNGRAYFFVGPNAQQIRMPGGGGITYAYLIINKPGGHVLLNSTDVTVSAGVNDVFRVLNVGALDLNGRALALANSGGGELVVRGGPRFVTSSVAGATLNISGTKTLSSTLGGALTVGPNVTVRVNPNALLTMNAVTTPLTLGGDVLISGSLALSTQPGGDLFIGGHFTNDGAFDAKTRNVTFNGAREQAISGAAVSPFYTLTVESGTRLVIPIANAPTVTDTLMVNIGGALKQMRTVNNATVDFLQISTDRYRGATLTTTQNLGDVTVIISTTTNGGCTTRGASSPVYATRCFYLLPQNNGAATVKLWVLNSQLNSLTIDQILPFRFRDSDHTWVSLSNVVTGTASHNYVFAQGDTAAFLDRPQSHAPESHNARGFLIGGYPSAPTAITLQHMGARGAIPWEVWFRAFLGVLLITGLVVGLAHGRRAAQ
jgi:hypothetical protein